MPPQTDPLRQIFKTALSDVTPIRLQLFLFLSALLALFYCLVAVTTVKQHIHAAQTVGYDAAPSVIASLQIRTGVEEMVAALSNSLLYPASSDQQDRFAAIAEVARVKVCKEIVAAAQNITYGSKEQLPIENIVVALSRYGMNSQKAGDKHDESKNLEQLYAYREALDLAEKQLLPNTDALKKANSDELETIYSDEKSRSALSSGLVAAVGMVLAAVLVIVQIYLKKVFRRRLNVLLLAATILTIVLNQHLYSTLRKSTHHLEVAKEDSYDSVVALLEARSYAYHASSAQSSWLLDRERAAAAQKQFTDDIAKIAQSSDGHNFEETLALAKKQHSKGEKFNLPGFSGYLADQFKNIRFDGEAQAALEALESLIDYLKQDTKMRELENSGDHIAAVKHCLGYEPNAGKYSFANLDDTLYRGVKINQEQFSRSIKTDFEELERLALMTEIATFFIILCTYLGLRPRMAEYFRINLDR